MCAGLLLLELGLLLVELGLGLLILRTAGVLGGSFVELATVQISALKTAGGVYNSLGPFFSCEKNLRKMREVEGGWLGGGKRWWSNGKEQHPDFLYHGRCTVFGCVT